MRRSRTLCRAFRYNAPCLSAGGKEYLRNPTPLYNHDFLSFRKDDEGCQGSRIRQDVRAAQCPLCTAGADLAVPCLLGTSYSEYSIEETDVPNPKGFEYLLKIEAAGYCHTGTPTPPANDCQLYDNEVF